MPRQRPSRGSKPPEPPEWYKTVAALPFKWWHLVTVIMVPTIALLAYQSATNPVTLITPENTKMLKQVFQSGEPWCILCHNESTPIMPSFEAVATRLKDEMNFGVLDCNYKLPDSGLPIFKRFRFNVQERPVVFVTGGGPKPKQIDARHTRIEYEFVKHVRLAAKKGAIEIENANQLRDRCTSKKVCALVLQGFDDMSTGARQAIDALMKEHREMTFGIVDSSKWLLGIEKNLPKYTLGENRLVIFKNTTAGGDKPAHSSNEDSTTDLYYIGHTGNFYDHLLFSFVKYANSEDGYYQTVEEPITVVTRPPPPPKRRVREPEPEPEPAGLTEEERLEREQKRREQMEEQMRNAAFEEDEDDDTDAAVEAALAADEEEEEEEVVDLDDN